MLKKLFNISICILVTCACILPTQAMQLHANEQEFLIVDDNQTDKNATHYFTYNGGNGNGANGWADSGDDFVSGLDELKTQHWTWSDKYNDIKDLSYTFTFKGTGVDLVGITPTGSNKNNFQLDGKEIKTEAIDTSSGKKESTLYSVKNLDYDTHTVSVTVPSDSSQKGLQISYARVYGAKVDPSKPVSIRDSIDPTIESGVNHFKYTGNWTKAKHEAYIDLGTSDSNAENNFYEVEFVGNKIEIEATKAPTHGKVRFSVDGNHTEIVDLYKAGNRENKIVYTVSGLAETTHKLKAVTLSDKTGTKIVNQVVKAYISHEPYTLKSLSVDSSLTLVEEATHKLNVVYDPVYANPQNLKFESADTEIVTVDSKGNVTAKKPGNTTLTVSADGVESKTVNVQVIEQIKQMSGSIVDENLQWTQSKRADVANMGTFSKELTAWQADKAIAEFVVYAKQSSLKNVTLHVSDLTDGKNKIAKENVEATFIRSTKAFTGMPGWNNHPENYPIENETNRKESSDILYSSDPMNIGFDKVQPVWVEINVPENTPAGIYKGTVRVSANDIDKDLTFSFNVKVQDIKLPDPSTYGETFDIELWQYPYSSAEYYGLEPFSPKHLEVLKSNMSLYKEIGGHAITATISEDAWEGQTYSTKNVHYPSMVTWSLVEGSFNGKEISQNFKFEYDFSDFDAWVQLNKDLGIGDKIVLYSIAPWHGSFTYYVGDELRKTKFDAGSDTYNRVWGDFFRAMVDHLDEKGWFNDAYVGIDERLLSAKAFDLIDTVKNKDGKTLKTTGAMDSITKGDHPVLARRITELTVGDNIVQDPKMKPHFDQLLKERDAKNLKTTLYSCTGHIPGNFSLSAPAESYWSMMYAYKNGTSGFLRWAYDAWVADPLNDATHSSFEAGDCFLVYPDEKTAKKPTTKSSLRLEKMAQGVRDINKLIMMKNEYPELSSDIEELLNNVQTRYEQSGYYLTENGKLAVAKDMNTVRDGIAIITEKYLELKENESVQEEYTKLVEAVEKAKVYLDKEEIYTKVSFASFKETYIKAQNLLDKDELSSAELKNAINELNTAVNALKEVADYSKVDMAIDRAKNYNADDYLNYDLVEKAIQAVERDLDITKQSQVDTMAAAINNAIDNLQKKVVVTPETDKTDNADNNKIPLTGDTVNYARMFITLFFAGAAMIILAKKKNV